MLKVTYIDHMGSDITVVNAARISFGGESESLSDKDIKLIKYLADNEHMSPFEHCILSVEVQCPLYIRSQIHRHRTFSYNEISRRYTSENIEFFTPDLRKQAKNNRQASDGLLEQGVDEAKAITHALHLEAHKTYTRLLELGVAREVARGVLPQNTITRFVMTGNLRNWVHFVELRLDAHAQVEVQEIGKQILTILQDKFPEATKALLNEKV